MACVYTENRSAQRLPAQWFAATLLRHSGEAGKRQKGKHSKLRRYTQRRIAQVNASVNLFLLFESCSSVAKTEVRRPDDARIGLGGAAAKSRFIAQKRR